MRPAGWSCNSLSARVEAGQINLRRDMATRDDLIGVRVAIMERVDRMQDRLTAIRDDIGINMGAVDAVKRANDNTREDLRTLGEQVTVMWRQLKSLEARVRDITGDPYSRVPGDKPQTLLPNGLRRLAGKRRDNSEPVSRRRC
jgi:hypothetical protein